MRSRGLVRSADDDQTTIVDMREIARAEMCRRPAATPARRPPDSAELVVGREDHFIVAWGRANAALQSKERAFLLSMVLNALLVAAAVYLFWWGRQEKTLVFVRDSLGNVVQADAEAFLRAGDRRTAEEFKAFLRNWVTDAFSWTPLDVADRLESTLRLVDKKAHPVAKEGMRLADRTKYVEQGVSGGIYEDGGREPQAVIMRTDPLEVMVSVQRYLVDRSGVRTDAGPLFVRAILREVPRSSLNGHGLMIVDVRVSEKL